MQLLYLDPRVLEADPQGVREDPGNVDGLAATMATAPAHGTLPVTLNVPNPCRTFTSVEGAAPE